jgi:hypothetical protein
MSENTVQQILDGTPLTFEFGGRKFMLRQPTTAEYDDAQGVYDAAAARWRRMAEIQPLEGVPAEDIAMFERAIEHLSKELAEEEDTRKQDHIKSRLASMRREIEHRTALDESVAERALVARDRYLTKVLLCDDQGKTLVGSDDAWERLPISLKNAARPQVWAVWRMVESVPLS